MDTPYGTVEVTPDTYQMLGKEQITENYKTFLDMRNDLIKTGKINPAISDVSGTNNDTAILTTPPAHVDVLSPLVKIETREDLSFNRKNGLNTHYVYGQIYPSAGSPRPSTQVDYSFHEYEFHLNSYGDIIEYITQHRSDMETVWIALWDNNTWRRDLIMPSFENVNGPIEYYFNYNAGGNYYDMYLYNPATRVARENTYSDTDTSTYISFVDASTELGYYSLTPAWYDHSTLEMWLAQVGSTFYNPTDVFSMGTVGTENRYVEVSGTSNNGHYITTHDDGSNVS